MTDKFSLSLIIPLFNEGQSVAELISSIKSQSVQPDEVIMVDGGSTDNTVQLLNQLTNDDSRFKIIEAGRAMPGKGRNIGTTHATGNWIAYTDAGIRLDPDWLEKLIAKKNETPAAGIIYGNFSPLVNNLFEKCAAISYVPPLRPGLIRTKSIVSCLLKKEIWEKAGGFPDWRATEDLVFIENAEKTGCSIAFAPEAMVYWHLRPNLSSTYHKFSLYSKYNVWAGRQAYWHYGVARQYLVMLLPLLMGIFHSVYWLLLIPLWMIARAAKRIWLHRYEFGKAQLINPLIVAGVILITFVIDMATFSGWIKALTTKSIDQESR